LKDRVLKRTPREPWLAVFGGSLLKPPFQPLAFG
jgi:hypothetical protein